MDREIQGPVYLDASALAKLYLPEPESDELDRVLVGRRDLLVSDLAITEIVSAVARRRREGGLEARAARRLYRRLLDDREAGYYQRLALTPGAHREAERLLLLRQGISLRAADALHLAMALLAEARTIATFDQRMRGAADSVGLDVLPAFPGSPASL